jgi:beta-barrel assembly-enhancing protease
VKARWAFLLLLLIVGLAIVVGTLLSHGEGPRKGSLFTLYRLIGLIPKTMDSAVSEILWVGEIDEKRLGEEIRGQCERLYDPMRLHLAGEHVLRTQYLNDLISDLCPYTKRKFQYKGYSVNQPDPNAMALPGGVILVTNGLWEMLESEADLVAILAHEIGHVELSHCMDMVKFELTARKLKLRTLGQLADFVTALLTRHSYSKTTEYQADEYAYKLIIESRYDPSSMAENYRKMRDYANRKHPEMVRSEKPGIVRDYFRSHPPLGDRINRYSEMANQWWKKHPSEKRYVGKQNYARKSTLAQKEIPEEWRSKGSGG